MSIKILQKDQEMSNKIFKIVNNWKKEIKYNPSDLTEDYERYAQGISETIIKNTKKVLEEKINGYSSSFTLAQNIFEYFFKYGKNYDEACNEIINIIINKNKELFNNITVDFYHNIQTCMIKITIN
jgi:hypothetical protein